MWDDEAWHELTSHAVRAARETGALNFLPLALSYRAAVHVHAGEFDLASTLINESDNMTELTGNSPLGYPSLLLRAWHGEDPRAAELIQGGARDATAWGEGRAIGLGHYLLAILYNGLGRHEDALASAEQAGQHDDLAVVGFSLVELVEAGARSDAPEAAEAALRRLEERADACGTDWILGALARSRALLRDGPDADRLYREAIERSRITVHLARTHLVYGEWLRRENRRADAREQLRTAYEMLRGFGANAFAERARRELQAAGENGSATGGRRTGVTHRAGSPDRRTNRRRKDELRDRRQLFISPRTVEWHLHKVFTKLDVNSRNKLRAALDRA